MKLFLAFTTIMVLTACTSNDVSKQSNRTEVQAECAKHYAHISDEFSRGSKIKSCMRNRGAL